MPRVVFKQQLKQTDAMPCAVLCAGAAAAGGSRARESPQLPGSREEGLPGVQEESDDEPDEYERAEARGEPNPGGRGHGARTSPRDDRRGSFTRAGQTNPSPTPPRASTEEANKSSTCTLL